MRFMRKAVEFSRPNYGTGNCDDESKNIIKKLGLEKEKDNEKVVCENYDDDDIQVSECSSFCVFYWF